jgi:2-polyprenyl-3-methyl-5-hydroxy-6-metoxy-1,4-benzoquinol methylase
VTNRDDFQDLESQFDTVVMLNVLEHLADEQQALRNAWSALEPGGKAIVLVPQHPGLHGTLDFALEHKKRYTRKGLQQALTDAGFRVVEWQSAAPEKILSQSA